MATAETAFGGGLNSSSGGELKLYLKWKRNTSAWGVSAWGVSAWGVSAQGVSAQGVSAQGGVCPGGVADTPLLTDRHL